MTPTHAPHTLLVLSALLLGAGACSSPRGDLGDYTGSGDETRGNAETTTTGTTTTTETTTETTTTTTTETTTGTPPETATTTTTGVEECPLEEAADQCCCFAHANDCGEDPTEVRCEATVACDDIMMVSVDDLVENPEALECALTALRDRTPGQIRVWYRYGLADDVDGWLFLYVQADGTVFANDGATAGDPYAREIVRRQLPAAEVFEQCLLEPEPTTRLACVEMALSGEPLETCLPRCDTGVP